jgi:TPR repeat protein
VQRDGERLEKSIVPAEQSALYARACEGGNPMACFRVASFGDGNYAEACEQGSPDACAAHGHALMEAKSAEAVAILEKGCNRGSGAACAHLAYLYAEGNLVARDHIRALELYTRACNLGDARGCYNVGVNHDMGRGISANHTRAAAAYEDACKAGNSMACTNLGFLYERGRGVIADKARAAELFQRGCEGSPCEAANLLGCVNLGNVYRDGIGVQQDYAKAAEIFRTACATETTDEEPSRQRACMLFAALQFYGDGVPENEEEAFRVFKAGCDKGDAFGCFNVGAVHEYRENYTLAAAFYDRACEARDAEGCYKLGLLYDEAKGVAFDSDRAATLFRRACREGFRKACER